MFIGIGACLKREISRRMDELLAKLGGLESSHKTSLACSTYQELLKVQEELWSLLYHKTNQKLAWAHRAMYKFSNKPGTLLAQALRGPRTRMYIPPSFGLRWAEIDNLYSKVSRVPHFLSRSLKP